MKAISAYIHGFKTAVKSHRLALLIYLSYLLIALLVAIPFYGLFRSAAGNSTLANGLMKGFDATIIREMLASGGDLFRVYLKAFLPWMVAFALLQVYLTGGIFSWISNTRDKFSLAEFSRQGRRFFWRFLKLMFYFLVINLILCLILYLPYVLIISPNSDLTDKQIVVPLIWLAAIHFVLLLFIMLWSDLVKSYLYEQDSLKVFRGIFRVFRMAVRKFFSFWFLGILLMLAPAILFIVYYMIRQAFNADTLGLIIMVFIIQQVFILLRVCIRIWRLSSVYRFYLSIINPIFGPGL
jgi:hypothetical protein